MRGTGQLQVYENMGGFAGNSAARTEGTCFQAHPCLLWWMTAVISLGTGAPEVQELLQGRYEAMHARKLQAELTVDFTLNFSNALESVLASYSCCNTLLNVVA